MIQEKWQSVKKTIKQKTRFLRKMTPYSVMLFKGCREGNVELVEMALKKGADINLTAKLFAAYPIGFSYGTPLVIALTSEKPERTEDYQKIADMLINHKDFNRENIGFISESYFEKKKTYSLENLIETNFDRQFGHNYAFLYVSRRMLEYLQKHSRELAWCQEDCWYKKFYSNGQKKEVGRFVIDNLQAGFFLAEPIVYFYENGQKKEEKIEFDGHKIIANYDENGKLIRTTTFYSGTSAQEDTQLTVTENFAENGKSVKKIRTYHGTERKILNSRLEALGKFPPLETRKLFKRDLVANYRMKHQKIR
jgi:hypothetical protein